MHGGQVTLSVVLDTCTFLPALGGHFRESGTIKLLVILVSDIRDTFVTDTKQVSSISRGKFLQGECDSK